MSNILLINPPLAREELFERGSKVVGSILPPLGLAYIAAVLEKNGHKVKVIDGIAEEISIKQISEEAKNFDFVGITATTAIIKRAYETAEAIKEVANIPVIIGGPHATALPEEVAKKKFVDFAVLGEGDFAMSELIDAINKKKNIDNVPGIAYLKNNQVKFTVSRPLIKNLDDVPLPARHLLPMGKYKNTEARSSKQPSYSMISSRGCPFNCSYCNKKIFGRQFRAHSPERVVEEMQLLKEKYGARQISIYDDNFTVDKKRVEQICRLLKEKNLNIPWDCEARVDCVDEGLLKEMKSAGCELIAYGVESGSERVLKSIRKGFTKEHMKTAFKWTKNAGISIRAYCIIGLIGETKEDIKQTITFVKELDPDIASFTFLVPFPGTDDYTTAQTEGTFKDPHFWDSRNLPEFNFLEKPMYIPKDMTESDLIKLHKYAYRSFYFRLSYILKKLLNIRSLDDIKWSVKGVKTLLKI